LAVLHRAVALAHLLGDQRRRRRARLDGLVVILANPLAFCPDPPELDDRVEEAPLDPPELVGASLRVAIREDAHRGTVLRTRPDSGRGAASRERRQAGKRFVDTAGRSLRAPAAINC